MLNESNADRYEEGQAVQVTEGAFAGFMGTIEAIDRPKRRLRVLVPLYGCQIPMEFAFDGVRKV